MLATRRTVHAAAARPRPSFTRLCAARPRPRRRPRCGPRAREQGARARLLPAAGGGPPAAPPPTLFVPQQGAIGSCGAGEGRGDEHRRRARAVHIDAYPALSTVLAGGQARARRWSRVAHTLGGQRRCWHIKRPEDGKGLRRSPGGGIFFVRDHVVPSSLCWRRCSCLFAHAPQRCLSPPTPLAGSLSLFPTRAMNPSRGCSSSWRTPPVARRSSLWGMDRAAQRLPHNLMLR